MVNEKESLEVLKQNQKTIEDMMDARRNDGLPFNFDNRELKLG